MLRHHRTIVQENVDREIFAHANLAAGRMEKPRGFSHGVVVEGPGRWVVLAGQTGGDETGNYAPDMAAQVGTALKRIIKLLARPEPVRSTSSA